MQATDKKMNNKIWLSILSVGVVIAIILGVVGIVNHNDTKANAIPTINQQVDNINSTLPELEKVSTELNGYIDTLETTVEKLQTDLATTNTAIDTLETEIYGKVDAEKTATLNQLKADKVELEGKIAVANKAIEDAKTANTASEKAITDQIAALEAELEKADADNKKALEDSIAALETALTKADADNKKALEDSIAALKTQVESNDASLTTAIQALNTNLSALIKANADNIATLQTTATGLQTQIDAINTDISGLKTELEGKISESEKKVLGELNTLKTNIEGQIATINADITALKAKDTELEGKIADLKTYVDTQDAANKTWAEQTFATLEQYNAVQTEIAGIKESINTINADIEAIKKDIDEQVKAINKSIADLDAELAEKVTEITIGYTNAVATAKTEITSAYTTAISDAITASEAAMQTWVNGEIQKVYAEIAGVQAELDALGASAPTDDELTAAVTAQQAALEQAKTDLTTAYEAAIKKAIEDNDGVIDDAISAAITDATNDLQSEIDAIKSEITTIKGRLDTLEDDVDSLKNRIQSITYVPMYSDGKVLMDYQSKTATVYIRLAGGGEQAPSTEDFIAAFTYVGDPVDRDATGGTYSNEIALTVSNVEEKGGHVFAITVTEKSDSAFSDAFWSGDVEAMMYIRVVNNDNYIATEMIPLVAHAYVTNTATINDFENGQTYEGKATE